MNFEENDLAEYAEKDLKELLDTGTYAEALRELDLSTLMEGGAPGGVVLHDRLIGEASFGIAPLFTGGSRGSNRPPIKDEHSYSLDSALKEVEVEMSDLESECYPAISIAEAEGHRPRTKTEPHSDNPNPEAPEDLRGLISPQDLLLPGSPDTEGETKDSVKEEENDARGASSPLQRQPSMETLSCCGDCEGCTLEDDLEDHSFLPPSPFSLIELPIQEEKGDDLLTGPSRRGDRQRSRYHPYFRYPLVAPLSSLDPPSPCGISQRRQDDKTCRSNEEEPSSMMTAPQNSPQHLSTIPTTFQQGGQREEVHSAPLGRGSLVVGPQHSIIPKCRENGFVYPPTPPSCSGSDSESGGNSPTRKSPLYDQVSLPLCNVKRSANPTKTTSRNPIHTPLISSQPKGATGSIHLTEEEKRTLISEGYPVPSQLPLSKAEEKSLKKIRRKIKNKISAQESRRKKKEYMDTLEHKVDILSQENGNYRRKLESLQYKNQQLLQELERLQNIVDTDDKRRAKPNGRTVLFAS